MRGCTGGAQSYVAGIELLPCCIQTFMVDDYPLGKRLERHQKFAV